MTNEITFVVAAGENGVIGNSGGMPDWNLKDDMARFKKLTLHRPVIMGRKTYDSMGSRALPNRRNIVITRQADLKLADAEVVTSLTEAINLAKSGGPGDIAIIGGGQIFAEAMPLATKLYFTLVHANPPGDAYFKFDPAEWQEDWREEHHKDDRNDHDYTFINYSRI
jgi:dihydrofolate reductase